MKNLIPTERIEQAIFLIRGQKVLLDADLALIYGVPTKVLNQAVKRNLRRFPSDFVFRLTAEELEAIQSQIAAGANRSQIVTGSQKHRDPRFLPYAFTEHGAIMAANVLNSRRAVQMSVFVVRAFVKQRSVYSRVCGASTAKRPAALGYAGAGPALKPYRAPPAKNYTARLDFIFSNPISIHQPA